MFTKIIQYVKKNFTKITAGKYILTRILKGGVWLSAGSGVEQILRLIRSIIFARLLLPEALAPFVIILTISTLFESFSQVGIREAIIQNPAGAEPKYLNGAWWFSTARGAGLFAIGFISAPLIAYFYKNPSLVPLMQFAFLNLMFKGIMSVKAYVAVKKMDFKKWVLVEQVGGIIGILTAIVLAYILRNTWALVIGFVMEGFARFVLSFIIFPYFPKWEFDKKHLNELFRFSRGMLGLPILTAIFMYTDMIVIGKICSETDIGLYGWILSLARIPTLLMDKLLMPVLMPAFSEIQTNLQRVNSAILKISKIFFFTGTPLLIFALFYSKDLLSVIYTPAYGVVAVPFILLFTATIFMNYNVPIVTVYLSLKQPGRVRLFTGIRALIVLLGIVPATLLSGLAGAAAVVLIAMVVSYIVQIVILRDLTHLDLKQYWGGYIPSLTASIPVILFGGIMMLIPYRKPLLNIAVGSVSLLLSYGLAFYIARVQNKKKQLEQVQV